MPNPQTILANLTLIANDALPIAVAWHGVTLVTALALLARWRPSRRLAAALLIAPLLSAGVVALAYHNPFNGVLLCVLSIVLAMVASQMSSERTRRGSAAATVIGISMIAFAWLYPHFLEAGPATRYLYAAPMGLIPCPSLALVIGFSLLAGDVGSRAWSVALAVVGLFYGLFGLVRLGVHLDIVLIMGSAALLLFALRSTPYPAPART